MAHRFTPGGDPTRVLGRRFLALVIDVVLLGVVAAILLATAKHTTYFGAPSGACKDFNPIDGPTVCRQVGSHVYVFDRSAVLRVPIITALFGFLDLVVVQTFAGGSIGKLFVGLRVVDADGIKADFLRNFGRWVFLVLDLAAIGAITALASHPHRRLGDFAAGTYVVGAGSVGEPIVSASRRKSALPDPAASWPPPVTIPGSEIPTVPMPSPTALWTAGEDQAPFAPAPQWTAPPVATPSAPPPPPPPPQPAPDVWSPAPAQAPPPAIPAPWATPPQPQRTPSGEAQSAPPVVAPPVVAPTVVEPKVVEPDVIEPKVVEPDVIEAAVVTPAPAPPAPPEAKPPPVATPPAPVEPAFRPLESEPAPIRVTPAAAPKPAAKAPRTAPKTPAEKPPVPKPAAPARRAAAKSAVPAEASEPGSARPGITRPRAPRAETPAADQPRAATPRRAAAKPPAAPAPPSAPPAAPKAPAAEPAAPRWTPVSPSAAPDAPPETVADEWFELALSSEIPDDEAGDQ